MVLVCRWDDRRDVADHRVEVTVKQWLLEMIVWILLASHFEWIDWQTIARIQFIWGWIGRRCHCVHFNTSGSDQNFDLIKNYDDLLCITLTLLVGLRLLTNWHV
jgi:hypothetical protein